MGLALGILFVFLVIGLLPLRGGKGFAIKAVILIVLGFLVFKSPDYWEGIYDAMLPVPAGPLQDKLGDQIGGGFLGPLGAILGLFVSVIMAIVLRKKKED